MIAKSTDLLNKAEKALRTADHMIYITYPLIKENKLLKSILEQIKNITEDIATAVLYYEWSFKRISQPDQISIVSSEHNKNIELFQKCSKRYDITDQEIKQLKELLNMLIKYKKSTIEFTRKDKLVLMSNNSRTESISLEQLKTHLNFLKIILNKTKSKINAPIWQAGNN